jgi:hypothetical protein
MRRQDTIGFQLKCCAASAAMWVCALVTPAAAHAADAAAGASAIVPLSITGPGSLTGVWGSPGGGESTAKTADGKPIPYQPATAKLIAQPRKGSPDGEYADYPGYPCVPGGMPSMMSPPEGLPLQILETPRQVTVLFGFFGTFRNIHMNEKHPPDPDPAYFGNSVAHWEGNTLVVDTIALIDKTTLFGAPHTEDMHLVERLHRADKDTLEDRITIEDPKTYTKPWTWVITLKSLPATALKEYSRHPC